MMLPSRSRTSRFPRVKTNLVCPGPARVFLYLVASSSMVPILNLFPLLTSVRELRLFIVAIVLRITYIP